MLKPYLILWAGAVFGMAVAASPAWSDTYPGPAGLEWGMPESKAQKVLSQRFNYQEKYGVKFAQAVEYEYAGTFAGFDESRVVATMYRGEFVGLTVQLPVPVVRPATRVWMEAVDKMRGKYGDPDQRSATPDTMKDHLAKRGVEVPSDKAGLLDLKIRSGEWKPKALWRFDNEVVVAIVARLGEKGPDDYARPLKVFWSFAKLPAMRAMHQEVEANKEESDIPEDF
ncbi:MAG TPA: hypothetical protein VKA55_09105 [Gammaproteobacteria bacterium]|nr:hypothetical protein [Gammaproteobacteria bacterium]